MVKRFWLLALLVGYALLAASTLVGERGLLHLWKLRQEQRELQTEVFALLRENEDLRNRINRLQTDNEFFEKIARETLKFAKKGEIIYLFQEQAGTSGQ
ncbi:MAG TPA: septum formation initiator family protein [Methylomirabilota bacterium]|nr:septum formation initiator family protein [Methylomirabilota bacterium]